MRLVGFNKYTIHYSLVLKDVCDKVDVNKLLGCAIWSSSFFINLYMHMDDDNDLLVDSCVLWNVSLNMVSKLHPRDVAEQQKKLN